MRVAVLDTGALVVVVVGAVVAGGLEAPDAVVVDGEVAVVVGVGGVVVVVGPLASGDEEDVSGPCRASTPTKPTVVALKMVMGRFITLSLDGVRLLVDGTGRNAGALREGDRALHEPLGAADEDIALGDVGHKLFDRVEGHLVSVADQSM